MRRLPMQRERLGLVEEVEEKDNHEEEDLEREREGGARDEEEELWVALLLGIIMSVPLLVIDGGGRSIALLGETPSDDDDGLRQQSTRQDGRGRAHAKFGNGGPRNRQRHALSSSVCGGGYVCMDGGWVVHASELHSIQTLPSSYRRKCPTFRATRSPPALPPP